MDVLVKEDFIEGLNFTLMMWNISALINGIIKGRINN
tara:strand:+ start:641 stop:751 length:111 start_codon:yes stop_codon:yes gene_type:complete